MEAGPVEAAAATSEPLAKLKAESAAGAVLAAAYPGIVDRKLAADIDKFFEAVKSGAFSL